MSDHEIDWGETARIEQLERAAYHSHGIVVVRLDREGNALLRRLAQDRAFGRFGPRETAARGGKRR